MKFDWKMSKDKWILMLLFGLVLLIVAIPTGKKTGPGDTKAEPLAVETAKTGGTLEASYEEQLEKRIKEILKNVEGVGQVDVMIVLKSTEEKVLRIDKSSTSSTTKENDSGGGTRDITDSQQQETTVLTGSGSENGPIVEKELMPQIEGIVISAAGGGSPTVKAEISQAMEALFNVPAHKIKVLKRVENN